VGTLQVSRVVSDPNVADEVLEQGIQNARMFLG
jgi:TetR/AcrR family transcriptional regulator, transcriptional repressor for nem operon